VTPARASLRLLFLNAYLLRPVSLGIGRLRWEPASAPAVADRAGELGRAVAGRYDVVALAEAFTPADRARVLQAWATDPAVAVGPESGWSREQGLTAVSSGLMTVVDGPTIVRRDAVRYAERGSRLADADPWAAKGALLVELDVGLPGRVELYSTHLCAGGGLLKVLGDRRARTDPVREAQAAELAAFVRRTHRPGNVVLVVGDMNVEEVSPDVDDPSGPHRALAREMGTVGLDDLWESTGRGWGPTCTLDGEAAVVGRPDPDDPDVAWDEAPAATGWRRRPDGSEVGGRIDRAFLQRPGPDDAVAVTDAVIRRRALLRRPGAPERRRLAHLSDHLGLQVELALEAVG
jgi:endonuclease/exonuclease/phosphatase family metal-dependent hydrolase